MPFQDIAAKVQSFPPETKASLTQIQGVLQRNNISLQAPAHSNIQAANADSNYAIKNPAANQNVTQAALSPTDKFAGREATAKPVSSSELQKPSPTPARAPAPSQGRGR